LVIPAIVAAFTCASFGAAIGALFRHPIVGELLGVVLIPVGWVALVVLLIRLGFVGFD
jgi:hypothetical protein